MTTPSELRDQAAALAVTGDTDAAVRVAESIDDSVCQAQALGHATRYAESDVEALDLARRAIEAASSAAEAHLQVVPSAWPIRALLERGQRDAALELLEIVLMAVPRIEAAPERAEALLELLHSAFDASAEVRKSLAFAIVEVADRVDHWRVQRALQQALAVLHSAEPEFAIKLGFQTVADDGAESAEPKTYFC